MNAIDRMMGAKAQEWLRDPKLSGVLSAYLANLIDGAYGDFIEVCFQGRERPTPADAYGFAQVHAAKMRGAIAMAEIHLDAEPGEDRERQRNNDALRAGLHGADALVTTQTGEQEFVGLADAPLFDGEFIGGAGDADGWIRWNAPLEMCVFRDERPSSVVVEPRKIPLEVGTTSLGSTMRHLMFDRAVARWPYGHDRLTLLVVIDPAAWRPNDLLRLGGTCPAEERS